MAEPTFAQIVRHLDGEVRRRELELAQVKEARAKLAKLVPGHPYGRPKLTVANVKVGPKTGPGYRNGKHWTQTPAGRRKMKLAALKRYGKVKED